VEVGEILSVSCCARCVAELNFGAFLCSFNHIRFVTEAVGKDNVTTVINEVKSSLFDIWFITSIINDREVDPIKIIYIVCILLFILDRTS
jgi:hypothetical protein